MNGWGAQLALVMAGGALGAGLRFWLGGALLRRLGGGLPWGTLAANLLGAFAIGFLAEWLQDRGPAAPYWRAFLIVGVLGALTTYSTLMLELLLFARGARLGPAVLYLGLTLAAGALLVFAGARLGALLR
ncbi:fluoride efflux transporter CrcB [Lysobacter pythonis]|uniref:Fluoride-specific ion channel FluC n=1 Tax=Solilutibacter pythonis TaxID=2483112 RepID=A0A3M2I0X8_9GAMM|nr:CrcB family protein [Lysobacter pythonis]RMH93309.1 fluoride efflux transporter CrcB [Lysobacter pythonis]